MAYIYDLSDQWANGSTTFTGIKLNVTDTASTVGSLLIDLQTGGVSRFNVRKDGLMYARDGSFGDQISCGLGFKVGSSGAISIGGTTGSIQFTPTNNASSVSDLFLFRDAANSLAQRNGVNAQAFNLYNTYTDASNYERGFMRFVSNVLQIGTDKLGTGAARSLVFQTDGVTRMTVGATGTVVVASALEVTGGSFAVTSGFNSLLYNAGILGWASGSSVNASSTPDTAFVRAAANIIRVTNGSTGGGAMQMTEMTAPAAPAADNVRIYAEDDGAGKTRLMARFATGAAVQIAIEP